MNLIKCQHPWTVAALLIANVGLGVGAGQSGFPLLAGTFLLAHLVTGFTLPGPPRALFALLLMVPFGLWSRSVLTHSFTGWFLIDLLMLIGFYGVALGGYILTSAQTPAERHQALATALFAFALAGAAPHNPAFAPLLALFVPVLLLQIRHELGLRDGENLRQIPLVRYIVALVLLLVIWLGMQAVVSYSLRSINDFMTRRMIVAASGGYVGYARNTRVSLHQTLDPGPHANRVMIRFWSPQPMEYLRGSVYKQYHHGFWQLMEETTEVRSTAVDNIASGRSLFNLASAIMGDRLGWVYPDRSLGHTFFLPLGTQVFAGYGRRVFASEALTVRSPGGLSSGGYEIFAPFALMSEPDSRDLEVPSEMRSTILSLARNITPDRDPPELRVQKIHAWFAEHFQYQLGMKRMTEKDPVLEFLEDQRQGHCEYFATAAVLMLRSIDIPARYVTGFVVREQAGSNLWLARQKDAHAWVELALPASATLPFTASGDASLRPAGRWITFDPTPPDAQPTPLTLAQRSPWGDWLWAWWERIAGVASVGGFTAVLAVLWESTLGLIFVTPWYIWLIIMSLAMTWVFRASIFRLLRTGPREVLSPQARAMRAKLRQAEKLARPFGIRRSPTTTVTRFRHQLAQSDMPANTRMRIETLLQEYQTHRFRPSDQAKKNSSP